MSKSMAKIWARRIHDGAYTLDDVAEKYGDEGVAQVQEAYRQLFGTDIPD